MTIAWVMALSPVRSRCSLVMACFKPRAFCENNVRCGIIERDVWLTHLKVKDVEVHDTVWRVAELADVAAEEHGLTGFDAL
jgi:hypothetical protein